MPIEIEEGFYSDPDSGQIFFIKVVKDKPLIPSWVKSKPTDWKRVEHAKQKIIREEKVN